MPGEYQVFVRDTSGVVREIITDWEDEGSGLAYTKTLDRVGDYELDLPVYNTQYQAFTKDAIVEVKRRDVGAGLDWYTDFVGLHRDTGYSIDKHNQVFQSHGTDLNHFLTRAHVMYPSDSPFVSQYGPADDCMKLFVDQNLGPSSTAPPRMGGYPAGQPNFQVQPLVGQGPLWSGNANFAELFATVHDIALASGVDFNIVVLSWSPLLFEFQTFYPFMGVDRTQGNGVNPPAVFTPQAGNMANPKYSLTSQSEITTVFVLGSGQQSDRNFLEVQSAAINDSPWNRIETSINQSQEALAVSLQQSGQSELQLRQQKEEVNFEVLVNENLVYGRDYNFGDKITVDMSLPGLNLFSKRITGVTVQMRQNDETISPVFSELT